MSRRPHPDRSTAPATRRAGRRAGGRTSLRPAVRVALGLVVSVLVGLSAGPAAAQAVGPTDATRARSHETGKSADKSSAATTTAATSSAATSSADTSTADPDDVASFANAEAFAQVCLEAAPERSAALRRAWAPDGSCTRRWARNAGQRGSDIYTERHLAVRTEMGRLPGEQLQAFCEALNAQPC